MSFRKWITVFLAAAVLSTGLLGVFNIIVDPFGVFGDRVLNWQSYNMVNNPRVAKVGYLNRYHEDYNSYVIGGSKSSSISPELLNRYYGGDASFYSMLMYGGDFFDYERTLYDLVDHYEVKHIVLHMSLQEISHFNDGSERDLKKRLHARVSGEPLVPFYWDYLTLSPKYAYEKLEGFARRAINEMEYGQFLPETGVYNKIKRDAENLDDLEQFWADNPSFHLPMGKLEATAMADNVAALARMKAYCEERDISFLLITGATYEGELKSYNLDDLKQYWHMIAEVTKFWDFSGFSPLSEDPRHYYDSMHYRNHVGDMMLARIFDDPEVYVPSGFGHYTTISNVSDRAEAAFTWPAVRAMGIQGEKTVPILMYHHLSTEFTDAMTIHPDKLRLDLEALQAAGYEAVTLKDLVDYVYHRIAELPEKPVVITFDDGYSSNYELAYPILQELGMKAAIGVIGWSVGETMYKGTDREIYPHFTWEEAAEMVDSGLVTIINHSYDMHEPGEPETPRKGVLQMEGESDGAYGRALIEDTMGLQKLIDMHVGEQGVAAYTYPYGSYTRMSEQILSDLGYDVTMTVANGVNVLKKGDPQSLKLLNRINAGLGVSGDALVKQIEDLMK